MPTGAGLSSLWSALRLALPSALLATAGCSTPRAAFDEADQSTRLMSSFDIQMRELRRIDQASEDTQRALIASQRSAIARLRGSAQLSANASTSSGDASLTERTRQMLRDADALAADRAAHATDGAASAKALAMTTTPLPDLGASVAEAQARMATMGTPLDRDARQEALRQFATEIRGAVAANRRRIKEAQQTAEAAAAAAAAGQTAPGAASPSGAPTAPATKP